MQQTLVEEAESPELTIATDSQSSLFLIRKTLLRPHRSTSVTRNHRHGALLSAIAVLLQARHDAHHTTRFIKVRSHSGIAGNNEAADAAARKAVDDDSTPTRHLPQEVKPALTFQVPGKDGDPVDVNTRAEISSTPRLNPEFATFQPPTGAPWPPNGPRGHQLQASYTLRATALEA